MNAIDIVSMQELVAYGVCNTTCSFLNCFSTCFSLSRSCVQEGAGGGTQIVGLVSSVLIFIVLLFLAPLFEPLPTVSTRKYQFRSLILFYKL
jgi:solute carrier family 26 protein